jgi:DNA-directed RNA polymerase II subunit RPB1
MWEINTVFGIEATRQFLIEEFMDVVTSDGTFVNSSHVELLVDLMVYTGSIISISRYGQKKVGSGPLSKASFEESLENFLKAGLNSEKETTDGVSASIMLGKIPKTGTGVFDLKMDIDAIINQPKPVDVVSPSLPIPPSVFKVDGVVEAKSETKKFKKANSLFA